MSTTVPRRRLLAALVIVLVTLAMAAQPVAAQPSDTGPAFVVEVQADGAAEVTLRSRFDLTTETDKQAFRSLVDDEQAQQDATARYLDRMRAVARDAENATGREMRVTDATIDLRTTDGGETGVVTLTLTWEGLAAVEGETVTVTEPFASGFAPDRPFVVVAPDGYAITRANPGPDERTADRASWAAGADLDGFAVEVEPVDPTESDDGPVGTDGQPGFGPGMAVLAGVVGGVTVAVRRRRN